MMMLMMMSGSLQWINTQVCVCVCLLNAVERNWHVEIILVVHDAHRVLLQCFQPTADRTDHVQLVFTELLFTNNCVLPSHPDLIVNIRQEWTRLEYYHTLTNQRATMSHAFHAITVGN